MNTFLFNLKVAMHRRCVVLWLLIGALVLSVWFGWNGARYQDTHAAPRGHHATANLGAVNTAGEHFVNTEATKMNRITAGKGLSPGNADQPLTIKGQQIATSPTEQKAQLLRAAIKALEDYTKKMDLIYSNNPHLREVEKVIRDIDSPKHDGDLKLHLQTLEYFKGPGANESFFNLRYCLGVPVTLDFNRDPSLQLIAKDLFEVVGVQNEVKQLISAYDRATGYSGGVMENMTLSYTNYIEALKERESFSNEVFTQKASSIGLPLANQEALRRSMRDWLLGRYLKLYHRSYFTNDVTESAKRAAQASAEFDRADNRIPVPQDLLQRYRQMSIKYDFVK